MAFTTSKDTGKVQEPEKRAPGEDIAPGQGNRPPASKENPASFTDAAAKADAKDSPEKKTSSEAEKKAAKEASNKEILSHFGKSESLKVRDETLTKEMPAPGFAPGQGELKTNAEAIKDQENKEREAKKINPDALGVVEKGHFALGDALRDAGAKQLDLAREQVRISTGGIPNGPGESMKDKRHPNTETNSAIEIAKILSPRGPETPEPRP